MSKRDLLAFLALLTFSFVSVPGCAQSEKETQREGARTVVVEPNTAVIVTIGFDNSVKILDREGNPAKPCQLCTRELEQKLGRECREADQYEVNICEGTQKTQVRGLQSISFLQSEGSTCFLTPAVGGGYQQVCYTLNQLCQNVAFSTHPSFAGSCAFCATNRAAPACN